MKTIKVKLLEPGHPDSVGYILDALHEISENPNGHNYPPEEVKRLKKIEKELHKSTEPLRESMYSINLTISRFTKAMEEMVRDFDEVIERLQYVSSHGWFISPDIIRDYTMNDLRVMIENTGASVLSESILLRHGTTKEISKIINRLSSQFPNRQGIFNEIKQAYIGGLYSSVIVLCYSQADGVCNQEWQFGFFDKKKIDNNAPYQMLLYVNMQEYDLGFSSKFIEQLGLSENELTMFSKDAYFNESNTTESTFNRHKVIHGHSTYFGNKVNALRAILLLDFLNHIVSEYRNYNSES